MKSTSISIATTGCSPSDEVLRITCFYFHNKEYKVGFDMFVKPSEHISWKESENLHGITLNDVIKAKEYDEVRLLLNDYLSNFDQVVCYDDAFLVDFLPGVAFPLGIVSLKDTCSVLNGEYITINDKTEPKYISMKQAFSRFGIDLPDEYRYQTAYITPRLLELYEMILRYYPSVVITKHFTEGMYDARVC